MTEQELLAVQELIDSAMSSLKTARSMLSGMTGVQDASRHRYTAEAGDLGSAAPTGRVIEGIFDGQNMVDGVGQTYPVPANYASKSKLVEGDAMKLTISDEGKFIYKQIAPIERHNVVGALIQEDGQYKVLAEGKAYRVLLASVTFYRAEVGDRVTIILPKGREAKWGAVENVIPRHVAEAEAKDGVRGRESDGELTPSVGGED